MSWVSGCVIGLVERLLLILKGWSSDSNDLETGLRAHRLWRTERRLTQWLEKSRSEMTRLWKSREKNLSEMRKISDRVNLA